MRPLHLALVWHMHQPYYKDDLTQTYLLPWVRLRSTKDYHKMAALLDGYPRVRQTFNLVPSLLAQIGDRGNAADQDLFLNLSRKPAAELTAEERQFILRWMRESPRFLRVQASPRYSELAARAETEAFSAGDILDLQVWYNLAWCDPAWADHDPRLSALKARDRDFGEADKETLFGVMAELVAQVIPKYAELAARGQAELTFSPHYHPILPLLANVESARVAIPQLVLPERHYAHPEAAERQIVSGREAFERALGIRPRGMWPPELAVGESVASMAVRAGVEWMISDEEVLARSLETHLARDGEGRFHQPELMYLPWSVERDGGRVSMVFRDGLLSNLIGFDYNRVHAQEAVRDFMGRLRRIQQQQGDERDFLVTVALDGENAWDFYSREGHDFLNGLYSELNAAEDIVCTTVADFLDRRPQRNQLPRLHTGSWIGASLDTWIGDPEHNTAWDLLAETRDWLEDHTRRHGGSPAAEAAWREIMITEGSDWYWWFSRKHDSGMDTIWDNQFRLHLRNVYKLLGARVPPALFRPILERAARDERRLPQGEFTPTGPADRAWEQAGRYEVGSGFGALHKPVELVERVLYGSDSGHLHVRVDSPQSAEQLEASGHSFWLYISGSPAATAGEGAEHFAAPLRAPGRADLGFEAGTVVRAQGGVVTVGRLDGDPGGAVAVGSAPAPSPLCFSVPYELLGKAGGEPIQVVVVAARDGRDVEQVPPIGSLGLRVPRGAAPAAGSGRPLRILIASAEVAPYAKAGGLADVTAALAKELHRQGHDVRLVLPRYRQVAVAGLQVAVAGLAVPLGTASVECTILEGRLGEVPVYFVDCPQLFDRDGLYGFGDDDARFIYLSRAAIEMLRPLQFVPEVIHVHDWQTALVPNLLERLYRGDPELAGVATVLTLHNLAFQGNFGSGSLQLAGLEGWGLMKVGIPHLDDVVNLLGRGVHHADMVTTVSERYALEIQRPEFGEGLDELIRSHAEKLQGIVNGIDIEVFDPSRDPLIPYQYSAEDPAAKALDRAALRAELGLEDSGAPLIAFISRFYEQKGLELIEGALPALGALDVQLAVLGTGDRRYEDMFRFAAAGRPGRVAAHLGFDAGLAQRLYAGADMLLMPSRFEPCGLAQLISLRYGTIPIVRATGGLADTVRNFDAVTDTGVGFVFDAYDPWQLFAAVVRASETFRHRDTWRRLVERAMREDVSWAHSAAQYVQAYRAAVASHGDRWGVVTVGGRAGSTGT